MSEHKELKESEESDFEESDFEELEEYKKFYEKLYEKYDFDKDTKTKYDSNGFDKDGKHKDTDIFFKKNINWRIGELKDWRNKNGEFSENINKKNISSYDFKKVMENILNGKIDDNNMIKKIKIINEIENDLNDLKENENINKLKNYTKKLRNSIYGKDKEKIKTDEAKSFEDQKGKGYVNLPIALSKIYTNNNSKELINNIKQLINDLYDSEQITKQVYNNLIKAITYK